MLIARYTARFNKDIKRLKKKHVDTQPLREVIQLILENTPESINTLIRRHNMHTLKGEWQGAYECHIANSGDWLLIWITNETEAVLYRTGTHTDLFSKK